MNPGRSARSPPGAAAETVLPGICNGRLTLETGVPISTSDQSAKTTLYFTPFRGNQVALYDGVSAWAYFPLSEISASLAALTADTNYDVFVYDSSGLTLELVAWTNGTTRATALALQDGVYVKTGATNKRYVGTIRINSSGGQGEDTLLKRFVWNAQNRVGRKLKVIDTTDGWTYATAAYRPWNNSTANRAEVVVGLAEEPTRLRFAATARNTSGASIYFGIGLDATNANSADVVTSTSSAAGVALMAEYNAILAVGYHYLQLLEYGNAIGTSNFYGDGGTTLFQSGAVGEVAG